MQIRMLCTLHHIEELLQFKPEGMTISDIARNLDVNRNTVARYLDTLLVSGRVEMKPIGSAKVFFLSKRVPLSRVMDIASDIILLIDENYVIIQSNENFAELVGLKKEDIVGMNFKSSPFTVLSDSNLVSHMVAVLDGSHSMTTLCLQSDKGVKHFVLTSLPTVMEDGKSGIWLLAEDITTRVLAEEALKASELKYRTLVEQSSEGILIGHPDPPHIFFVNSTMCNMLGYTYDEMTALSAEEILNVIHVDDREQFFQNLRILLAGKPAPDFNDIQVVRKDGGLMWMNGIAKMINYEEQPAVQVTFVDITERKNTDDLIRYQNVFLENVIESLSHPLYVIDSESHIIKLANSIAHLGPLTDSSTCYAITHQTDEPCTGLDHTCPLKEVMRTKKSLTLEHVHYDVDGKSTQVEIHAHPILDAKGDVVDVIEYTIDITQRKNAERALIESENRYRSLFEDSPIALFEEDFSRVKEFFDELHVSGVTDFRDHFTSHPEDVEQCMELVTVLDVNKVSLNLHGVKAKTELIGPLSKIFGRDGLHTFSEQIIALAEGLTFFRSDDVQLTLQGQEFSFIFQLSVPPGFEDSLSKVYLSVIDVTERFQAEMAVQDSEERYRPLFDNAGEGILVADIETRQFKFANSAICRMLGYTNDELIGLSVNDIHPKESLESTLAVFEALTQSETPERGVDIPCLRKDKTTLFVNINASIIPLDGQNYIVGFFTDITKRKLAEEALKKSELRFRELFTSTSASIGITNLDENLVYVNQAFADALGYDVDELTGMNLLGLIPSYEVEKILGETTNRKKGVSSIYDLEMNQKDGGRIVVRVSAVPRKDQDGIVTEVFGYMVDITEHTLEMEQITKQMENEQLVRRVAERFIMSPNQEQAVINSLSDIANYLKAERAGIFLIEEEMKTSSLKYEWCAPGAPYMRDGYQSQPITEFSWVMYLFESRSPICIQDVSTIPDDSQTERELLQSLGIHSLVIAPLSLKSESVGFIVVGFCLECSHSEEEYNVLQVCADIIAKALQTV